MNAEAQAPAPNLRPYKRRVRNIFIHKPMQREFSFVLIALLMISTLAIGFVIHETIREAAFGGGFRFGKINPYDVLSEVRYQLILKSTCILFVTLIVIGIFAIFFLHRIAGPVYRFHRTLADVNDGGKVVPIKLREGDFFHETANEINKCLKWREEVSRQRAEIQSKIDQALASSSPEAMSEKLQEVKRLLGQPS